MKWKFWKKEKKEYIIAVDEDFVKSSMAYIGQATSELAPLLQYVIGVPLGFYVINKIIKLVEQQPPPKLTFWQKLLKFFKL